MTGRESLLTAILDCGTDDLSLLDDVQYDWYDIFKRLEDDTHDLNSVMREVFQVGYEDIQIAVDDRICELEAIELDNDEADELTLLRELDAPEDFSVEGEAWTRTYFLECLGERCAAYRGGCCMKFGETTVDTIEEEKNGTTD